MPSTTEKIVTLHGCRIGPLGIRQIARIASGGLEAPKVTFAHSHDGTSFSSSTLEGLVEAVQDSSVVASIENCQNLTITVHERGAENEFTYISLKPDGIYISVQGDDRPAVLGKFETIRGYLAGFGAHDVPVSKALLPSVYIHGVGLAIQLTLSIVGKFAMPYVLLGTACVCVTIISSFRMKKIALERHGNVINAIAEPPVLMHGWAGLSIVNKIATVAASATVIAAIAAVASAAADWFK